MLSIARGSDRPPVRCICRRCTTTSRTFWVASLQILLEKDEILTYGFSVVYLEEIILGYQSYPDGKGTQNFPHVYLPVTCEYGSKFEFHVLFCGPKFVAFCIPFTTQNVHRHSATEVCWNTFTVALTCSPSVKPVKAEKFSGRGWMVTEWPGNSPDPKGNRFNMIGRI